MQQTAQGTFAGVAVIKRRVWASDGGGGGTAPYNPIGTVDCHTTPGGNRPTNEEIAAQVAGRAQYLILVPAGTDVRAGDRIQADGREFEVLKALSQDWEIELPVDCVEIPAT